MRTDVLLEAGQYRMRDSANIRADLVRLRKTGARMAARLAELTRRLAELEEKIHNHQRGRYG
jgi:hypothetical protein